ncbi:MAG: type I methionyl aminopeptidase [Bacteroidia bacterium]|nr:type I methionyl aminopeptidase [Bacteroidia bacterium]MDW8301302.1 type I methionyl aminopeptidase [Bacteroidia bacterium]
MLRRDEKPIVKTSEQIEKIRKSCQLVSAAIAEVGRHIRPGVSTLYLDKIAETFIRDHGGIPIFKGYTFDKDTPPFPGSICASINEVVVHGIPSAKTILKEGDIISIDCGVVLDGYVGDSAYTFGVGEISAEKEKLLRVTKEALNRAIAQVKVGNRLGDLGYAVQSYVESFGFSVVRDMVGHGVGIRLHEPPDVPNYGKKGHGKKFQANWVLAIEPMVNVGGYKIEIAEDKWTVITADRKPSAQFEHTVAIFEDRTEILTTFAEIEQLTNVTIYG